MKDIIKEQTYQREREATFRNTSGACGLLPRNALGGRLHWAARL